MIDLFFKAIIFIIIFLSVVLVHEGGHFLLAKKSGIGVKQFFIGFGPAIFSKTYNGTEYLVRVIPFGGACIFEGLEDESDSPTSFHNASVFGRIATVAAGPIFNFLLAFLLSIFVIGSIGYDPAVLYDVIDGYPAQEAGLEAGDIITKIDNKAIVTYRDIRAFTMFSDGKPSKIEYERNGERYSTVLSPVYDKEADRLLFGFYGAAEREKPNPIQVIRYSAHEVWYWIDLSYKSILLIFKGNVSKDDFAGPVGIAHIVGDTYDESKPDGAYYIWLNMMNLTILFTVNLGVMNLLPLPALDGGRLIFLLIEAVTRKRVDPEKEAIVHFAGIMALMLFMVFIMFNDVSKFFR